VTRVLDQVIAMRGKAQSIRLDNGPELNEPALSSVGRGPED